VYGNDQSGTIGKQYDSHAQRFEDFSDLPILCLLSIPTAPSSSCLEQAQ
jgi:hypothetical protein